MQIEMNREGLGIRIQMEGARLKVRLKGGLNTQSAPELEFELEPMLKRVKEFVVDLTELDYITSAGLRFLLKAAQIFEKDGVMTVENPNSEVREILNRTGFDTIMTIISEQSEQP